MVFEDVGRVWREQGTGDFQRRRVESLSTVRGRADKLLSTIHRNGRWVGGLTLFFLTLGLFAAVVDSPRRWMVAAGWLILIAWLVRMLISVRRFGAPRSGSPLPVREAVESEVSRLLLLERFWSRIHRGVPMFLIGEILVFEGTRPPGVERDAFSFGFYAALFALVTYTIVARGRDARRKVRPLREELESWLEGLEAFDFDPELDAGMQGGTS